MELSGELHDFLEEDLRSWYPELARKVRITLVEALPNVLPMFSKQLIDYTESTFKESQIDILTKTMVKEVKPNAVVLQLPDKTIKEVPCGLVVWAAVSFLLFLFLHHLPLLTGGVGFAHDKGNKQRKITQDLMSKLSADQKDRRGLSVDGTFSPFPFLTRY